jgi:hypothetical protein
MLLVCFTVYTDTGEKGTGTGNSTGTGSGSSCISVLCILEMLVNFVIGFI